MFSKTILKKMVQELSPAMLISMSQEALDGINANEVNDAMLDATTNVEIFMIELKRRHPNNNQPPQPTAARRNKTAIQEEKEADRSGFTTDI